MDEQNALIEELRRNPAKLKSVMSSRDAQALLRALNRDGFREAVRSAAAGDTGELARRLREVGGTPDGAALLDRLERSLNGQGVNGQSRNGQGTDSRHLNGQGRHGGI